MKAGKLAIWPWLSCPYNKHKLVGLPSSVFLAKNISYFISLLENFTTGIAILQSPTIKL
jgi:hypothetical protein